MKCTEWAALDAGDRDTARLDWLERNFLNVFAAYSQNRWLGFSARRFPGVPYCDMTDLRSAIDSVLRPDDDRGLDIPESDAGASPTECTHDPLEDEA